MVLSPKMKLSCCLFAGALLLFAGSSAQAQSATNLRLMPVGDSITSGFQSSTGNGYRGPLYSSLTGQVATVDFVGTQDDGIMADADNEGHSGWRIDQIAGIINNSLSTYKPNIITLLIGVNDIGQNYQVSTAPTRLASLIDQILAQEPDATLLVSQLIVNSNATTQSEINTYNAAIPGIVQSRASAGKHILMVTMNTITTADLADGLHPNDTGYQLMGNTWDAAIEQVIANGWVSYPLGGSATRPVGAIYSGEAGICLDNYGNSSSNGVKADIQNCSNTAAQHWNLNAGNIHSNGLCLDIVGGGTANGTLVDLWGCNNGANQVWTPQSNGTLINPASGRCLDIPALSTTGGTQLDIWDCNAGSNQQWRLPSEGELALNVAGVCLDVPAASDANGTKAEVWGCNNSNAQQWKVFNNIVQFDGKCLDVVGGGTANGTLVDIWQCDGAANQVWTPLSNGTLVNPASGRCLDDPGYSATNGTQFDLWDCNGGTNQKWTLPAN